MAEKQSTKIKAWFLKFAYFSKFMQQFYPKIMLDHIFLSKGTDFDSFSW